MIELQGSKILLHGPPGIGKTQTAASFPTPTRWITTEPGHKYIPPDQKEYLTYLTYGSKGWVEFNECLKTLDGKQFKTIVVDTINNLYESCLIYVCSKNNVKHPSDIGAQGKGWSLVRAEFRRLWSKLIKICDESGATLIVIGHSEVATLEMAMGVKHKIMCSLGKQERQIVVPNTDHRWYLGYDEEGTKEGVLKTFTENRVLWLMGNTDTEASTKDPDITLETIPSLPKTGQYDYILQELNK